MKFTAWVLAGLSAVCKTARDGFDSRPRLHIVRSGDLWWKRPGSPRVQNADLVTLIFFDRGSAQEYRRRLKLSARSKTYRPPTNPIHLARQALQYERMRAGKYKTGMIAAKREISALKRSKR